MDSELTLKVKTIDEINFEQYKIIESDNLSPFYKKFGVLKKSKFSQGNSMIFDSEDENVENKENAKKNINRMEEKPLSPLKGRFVNKQTRVNRIN